MLRGLGLVLRGLRSLSGWEPGVRLCRPLSLGERLWWWERVGEGVLRGFLFGACFGFSALDATVMAQSCRLREETGSSVLFPG